MDEIRQDALKALRRHKSGWIGLGKILVEISTNSKWKEWGYEKFWDYAKEELGLSTMTAKEMMTAYEYIKSHEPSVLNTIESKQDSYVPDYHTLASLSKAKEGNKLSEDKEDKIRDTLFNAGSDTAIKADREARGMLAESGKSGEEIMDDIRKKTIGIKKRVKKIDKDIHETSSFGPEVLETSEKLNGLVEKIEA
jgi:hypothetical protein